MGSGAGVRTIRVVRTGQLVAFGRGAASTVLAEKLRPHRRILLVTGRASFEASGAASAVRAATGPDQVVVRFADFAPNPSVADLDAGLDVARNLGPDIVVGIGGGSAMDLAKAIAAMTDDPAPASTQLKRATALGQRGVRLVLVPTTAGTGSEVTRFATIYDGHVKRSLDDPQVLSDVAIVDPTLSSSAPRALTAATGLDALSHAVESFWSRASSPRSSRYARAAFTRIAWWLPRVLAGTSAGAAGGDQLARAATFAGLAIDLTRTTAGHGFSYSLTTRFGVPHGVAVALNLRWVLAANADPSAGPCVLPGGTVELDARLRAIVSGLGCERRDEAVDLIDACLVAGGFPTSIGAWGLTGADIAALVDEGLESDRTQNNPRALSRASVAAAVRAAEPALDAAQGALAPAAKSSSGNILHLPST